MHQEFLIVRLDMRFSIVHTIRCDTIIFSIVVTSRTSCVIAVIRRNIKIIGNLESSFVGLTLPVRETQKSSNAHAIVPIILARLA